MYNADYFEKKYKYPKKRNAVRQLYKDLIVWVDKHLKHNIFDGRGKYSLAS